MYVTDYKTLYLSSVLIDCIIIFRQNSKPLMTMQAFGAFFFFLSDIEGY